MAALETGSSSLGEPSGSGQALGISEVIAEKKIELQSKPFCLRALKNHYGPIITVTEQKKTEQQMRQVPADPSKRYEKCLIFIEKAAVQFKYELKMFWDICGGSDNLKTMKSLSRHTQFDVSGRSYELDMKEETDTLGGYLQVSCQHKDRLSSIRIPISGLLQVHNVLCELIKIAWPPAESSKFACTLNDAFLKHDTNEITCIDAGRHKEGQGNLVKTSAAKRKSQKSTTEQAEHPTTLYVAVQLRMSRRRTHLEVQVLIDNNKQKLIKWQQKWNKNISDMKPGMNQNNFDDLYNKKKKKAESDIKDNLNQQGVKRKKSVKPNVKNELHQLNVPHLQPVILQDFRVNQPVAARLTSSAHGSARLIHYGCHESTPCVQPRGYGSRDPHTWVFQLSDKPRSDNRQFLLHLHKAASTDHDKAWGEEICNAFTFQDIQGLCFLSHLGFTQENQPVQRTPGAGDFGRIAKFGEVMNVQSLKQTMQYHQFILKYSQSVGWISGPKEGTGFCIGNDRQKYVMTCRHIFAGHEEDFLSGKFSIAFSNFESGETSFVLRDVVMQDATLDYAILKLEESEKAPQPIPCCSSHIDYHQCLTIIGFRAKGDLAFDSKVEQQMLDPYGITLVKDLVSKQWPQFPHEDYDEITTLAQHLMLYNVASHKHGSSGSPVLLFMPDNSFKLVAVHRCGFPKFYYDNENVRALMTENYAVEAGTRFSSIYAHLLANMNPVVNEIF